MNCPPPPTPPPPGGEGKRLGAFQRMLSSRGGAPAAPPPPRGGGVGGGGSHREKHEMAELEQLGTKGRAKIIPVRHIERAVSKTMITSLKCNHSRPARRKSSRLKRSFDGFETGVTEDGFSGGLL